MKHPFRSKTYLSVVTVVLLSFLVGLLLCFLFATRFFANIKQRSMIEVYEKVTALYDDEDSAISENTRPISTLCEENTISIMIMEPSGVIDYAYGNINILMSRLNDIIFSEDSLTTIIRENDQYTLQTVANERGGNTYIEIWGFLSNGNAFIARSSYAGISNQVRISMVYFCIVTALVFIFMAFAIFIITKSYSDSIYRVLAYAQKANEGDYGATYENKRKNDEIGMIGENISEMSAKLEKTISELKTTNLRLENELKDKIALEEARKKYMSDVSHELKTPIALISGYAEGLKEGISTDPEDIAYYCDVIIDESEKMNLMIKKLATLNQLEQGRSEVSLERFNVVEAIDGFLNTMSIVIEEKNIQIFFNNNDVIYVWSDEFLFEEVLMNYFNNAVNHLDENRIIRINAEHHDENNVRVTVYNSGSGIDESEMDQIWGKFYKIDKARTREYGGSGLGLSIVKAVAESLGRECGVYNMEGGVAFWIDLEAAYYRKDDGGQVPVEKKVRHKITDLPIWKTTVGAISGKRKKDGNGTDK